MLTNPDIAIGIESGICKITDEKTVDVALIVLLSKAGEEIVTSSTGIVFPQKYVEIARKKGFTNTTVGSVIAEELGGDGTDPHAILTDGKITRTETLIDALIPALEQYPWPQPK